MRIPYLGLSESIYTAYSFEPTVQDIYNKMNKITEKEMAKLKKGAEYVGNEIKKGAEFIGHEIKENTELAEHETGVREVKQDAEYA